MGGGGGFMCCCEYTQPHKGRVSHNLHHDSVNITPSGLGISFWSDKVSHNDPTAKHHMVYWAFLLPRVQDLFTQYDSMRPKEAQHYFVHEDGQEVTRDCFLDFLDVCLVQTDFYTLIILPHCFRIGGASWACHEGQHILQIRADGCLGEQSKAIEPYLRLPFMDMTPQVIHEKHEHFCHNWHLCRVSHMAQCVVQTQSGRFHPFHLMFLQHFPGFTLRFPTHVLTSFPSGHV